jgi:hypothetical protein
VALRVQATVTEPSAVMFEPEIGSYAPKPTGAVVMVQLEVTVADRPIVAVAVPACAQPAALKVLASTNSRDRFLILFCMFCL